MTTRMIICGGRFYHSLAVMSWVLSDLCTRRGWVLPPEADGAYLPNVFVITGGGKGADALAIEWAMLHFCEYKEFPADWKRYGKPAGPLRNRQMIVEGKPDVVVAFPGGRGTDNMVGQAKFFGVEVVQVCQ